MKLRVKRHTVVQPLDQSYRFIPLTQGQNAIVDAEDFDWLSQWNWYALWNKYTKTFYAIRYIPEGSLSMHREIMRCRPGEECDHKNFEGLDNRKVNLRRCSQQQNKKHKRRQTNNSSGYKGVSLKRPRKWVAQISTNGKRIHLGYFTTPKEAAMAYDVAAKWYYGEFAHLNFPN